MRKIILSALFGTALVLSAPGKSEAFDKYPATRHGHTWFGGVALNTWPWLHFHGPLYHYGPYNTPGHVEMFVKNPKVGAYVPAYPGAYAYPYYGYPSGIIYPNFPVAPMQTLTAPTNLYYSQAEPPQAPAVATTPAPASTVTQPAATAAPTSSPVEGRTPLFSGQFRANFRR